MHYFQFEIKEWLSNTAHLTLEEEAVYLRLINFYYDSERAFLEQDIDLILRKCRILSKELAVSVLNEFFLLEDGAFHHIRCEKEIAKYHAKCEQASKAGKASAQRKTNGRTTTAQPIINQESLIINHKSNIEAPAGVSLEVWNDFVLQRKKSKAVISENVIKTIAKEAAKANWTLEQALAECAARGWRGFKAEWVAEQAAKQKKNALVTNEQIEEAYRTELGKDPKLARFGSYYEMKDFIIKHREKGARNV
jgi:uncharacterized protein YdaU (DUF1376 family)